MADLKASSLGAGMGEPSRWVARFAPLVKPGGTVLDLACGGGRHMRHFLNLGHKAVGIDLDLRGVEDLRSHPNAELVAANLEGQDPLPFAGRSFAAIVVTNYLHRPLFPDLIAALEPKGVLIYETFARGNERIGRPATPAFLLRNGELLDLLRGKLQVVAYEHGEVSLPKAAIVQRICAVNDARPRPDLDGDPEPYPLPAA